ncbi:hypothetical protein BP5796_07727 [Coleophoma crateriformis]|uniref:Transcriptional activator of proteases prtT n=1 Tax=Coleophoma crateriformis TaxID=565419 RepID=A0A3D8RCA8_9HELO|nr:hypothetical protein BP5796_07727 [Coleophoma crateriformis]
MSLSKPPTGKRKHPCPEGDAAPAKRKVRSCDTCRRLKTRCESGLGLDGGAACHRCGILKLECSLDTFEPARAKGHHGDSEEAQEGQECLNCNERMLALETSLAEMRSSLDTILRNSASVSSPAASRVKDSEAHDYVCTPPKSVHQNGPLVADHNSRTAPASLIRDMKHYLLGAERETLKDASEDVISKGIITEEMAHTLLAAFSQISKRWLFMKSNVASTVALRQTSPLLFATCVLAGLQINPSQHVKLHQELYQHVSSLLSKSMLVSPLSLEAIQAMLIFSMWNLAPDNDTSNVDTWLLSGITGMQGSLAINFEQLLKPAAEGGNVKARETLRAWNLICLCHLQFSVGTGRPPVISRQYLNQCSNILRFPSYDSRDQMVAAGVELYDTLCTLTNSDIVQTDSLVWEEIDNWKRERGQFFELDSTKPLRFAYSCAYLILARRTLKHLSDDSLTKVQTQASNTTNLDPSHFFLLAIEHAHRILHLFLAMSGLTALVRPAYEVLLCSFAMVTLSEFAIYLEDVDATLALMERTSQHVPLGGKAEPVSKWALGVMKKYVFDSQKTKENNFDEKQRFLLSSGQDSAGFGSGIASPNVTGGVALPDSFDASQWGAEGLMYQDFPSLEDMFLGN